MSRGDNLVSYNHQRVRPFYNPLHEKVFLEISLYTSSITSHWAPPILHAARYKVKTRKKAVLLALHHLKKLTLVVVLNQAHIVLYAPVRHLPSMEFFLYYAINDWDNTDA